MDILYTFGDNTTHYETKRVQFLGLMDSATKIVNGGTLNFLALYISSILESLNFLGPGC